MNKMKIKLIKSTFFNEKDTKQKLCNFIMKSQFLSMWKECEKFEKKFSYWQWTKYSTLVNSGSSANLVLIQALLNLWILTKNDNIWFSSVTWATNVMPLIQLWLNPIPIDVELETLNCSLNKLKIAHNNFWIKVFFLTNLLWFSDDIEKISKYCIKNKIILIEDNCESLWSEFNWNKLGNFWLASTFSFFVWHHMSCIEWWMLCTKNKILDNEFKKIRAHGWDRNLTTKEQNKIREEFSISEFYSKYTFYDLWYNVRPTEITWFLWNIQLKYIDEIVKKRQYNYNCFLEINKLLKDYIYIHEIKLNKISNFAMPLIFKNQYLYKKYFNILHKKEIEIRPIVWWLISKQPFFKKYINKKYNLPNAEIIHKYWIYFWNNPEMTQNEINYIINSIKNGY